MGLDYLYTGRAGGSARGKGYNNIFLPSSAVCSMWPIACCVAGVKRDGEERIWAREGGRKGTPARRPLFSPLFTLRL